MTTSSSHLLGLADLIDEASDECLEWARDLQDAHSQEIFVAQVTIDGTLKTLSRKLRALAAINNKDNDDGQ